jgi:hypothetical protein
MAKPVDVFLLLPEIAGIGQHRLQGYCDQWLTRPIANQFGCTDLIVGSDLLLTVNISDRTVPMDVGRVFLPLDELAAYIIDEEFSDATKRRELQAELRVARRRLNEVGSDYRASAGRSGHLWLKCKNPGCDVWLETAQRAVEGQTITCPAVSITCPACNYQDSYDGNDLVLRLDN